MNATRAHALIARYGRSLTLRQRPGITGTPVDVAVAAAARAVKDSAVDGVTVLRGDRKYLIAASEITVAPTPSEFSVIEDGVERSVIDVRTFRDRNAVIAYDCTARI